jgi:outer membrane murein-binding lipoprotein Lpp
VTLKDTIINAVAGTLVLGLGGTVVGLKVNDAKQDERIARVEQLNSDVNGLRGDLSRVDVKLERLNTQLEDDRDQRPRK